MKLKIDQLHPHPNNPRKDVGDVSELADSIRANGILQNLTVIPENETYESFKVLIGHRRLAAAKEARLTEVPCTMVEKLDEKQQLSIMLNENIQRSDLTPYEQAQGFQLMMNLGSTVEEISNITGFKKTMIYNRLNIAKLDETVVEKATAKNITISDLIALEKIKDIETRNEILSKYGGSSNFDFYVESAIKEAHKKELFDYLEPILEEKEIRVVYGYYGEKEYIVNEEYKNLKVGFMDDVDSEKLNIEDSKELICIKDWQALIIAAIDKREKESGKVEETAEEKKAREEREILEDKKENLAAALRNVDEKIYGMIEHYIKEMKSLEVAQKLEFYELVVTAEQDEEYKTVLSDFTRDEEIREKLEIEEINTFEKMLIQMACEFRPSDLYQKYWNEREDDAYLEQFIELIVKHMELELDENDKNLIDGTHEMWEVVEKKEGQQ